MGKRERPRFADDNANRRHRRFDRTIDAVASVYPRRVKPVKNLPSYALFLALAAVPAFAALACGDQKPPMTPDGFAADDGGAAPALPATDGLPTTLPSVPSAGSLMAPPSK